LTKIFSLAKEGTMKTRDVPPLKGIVAFAEWSSNDDLTAAIWPKVIPFPAPITDGRVRFDVSWHQDGTIKKLVGLVIEVARNGLRVYGLRYLQRPQMSGHDVEGRVNVGGKNYRAFTSTRDFLVEGQPVTAAVLYLCRPTETAKARNQRLSKGIGKLITDLKKLEAEGTA